MLQANCLISRVINVLPLLLNAAKYKLKVLANLSSAKKWEAECQKEIKKALWGN